MQAPTYTEQDIQDYASGNFTGDIPAFETYLQQNPAAMQEVKEYQELYMMMKAGPIPALPFNFADKVIRLRREPASFRLLPYALIVIGIVAAMITLKYFFERVAFSFSIDTNLLAASSIIMIAFLAAFCYIEVKHSYMDAKKIGVN